MNYYNENDPKAAAWLRELIKEGHISEGVVDERSIVDVLPADLQGYRQCHFFAGIGGWSYALRLAGVPDDEPVWTGSCPCQPFSNAGLQLGTADARHLWPVFFNLIRQCIPATVFGEQVASKAGRTWLSGVFADLESVAYAAAGADLCAAGVRSPHIRQRLYWLGHAASKRWDVGGNYQNASLRNEITAGVGSSDGRLEHAQSDGREQRGSESSGRGIACGCGACRMGDSHEQGSQGRDERRHCSHQRTPWETSVVIACTDGKTRRIEPGIFPLAHGVSGRVGLLRGAGNAIVPQVAAEFISAFYEARDDG